MWTVEFEGEADGRWIAEILEVPGALAYGATRNEALKRPPKAPDRVYPLVKNQE